MVIEQLKTFVYGSVELRVAIKCKYYYSAIERWFTLLTWNLKILSKCSKLDEETFCFNLYVKVFLCKPCVRDCKKRTGMIEE